MWFPARKNLKFNWEMINSILSPQMIKESDFKYCIIWTLSQDKAKSTTPRDSTRQFSINFYLWIQNPSKHFFFIAIKLTIIQKFVSFIKLRSPLLMMSSQTVVYIFRLSSNCWLAACSSVDSAAGWSLVHFEQSLQLVKTTPINSAIALILKRLVILSCSIVIISKT